MRRQNDRRGKPGFLRPAISGMVTQDTIACAPLGSRQHPLRPPGCNEASADQADRQARSEHFHRGAGGMPKARTWVVDEHVVNAASKLRRATPGVSPLPE